MRAFPDLLGIRTSHLTAPGKWERPVNGGFNDRVRILLTNIADKLASAICVGGDEEKRVEPCPAQCAENPAAGGYYYKVMSCGPEAVMQPDEQG
jgi:hypothetical protein